MRQKGLGQNPLKQDTMILFNSFPNVLKSSNSFNDNDNIVAQEHFHLIFWYDQEMSGDVHYYIIKMEESAEILKSFRITSFLAKVKAVWNSPNG